MVRLDETLNIISIIITQVTTIYRLNRGRLDISQQTMQG